MPPQTRPDRWLDAIRNNPYVAAIVVAAAIIGGVAALTNSVSTIWEFIAKRFGYHSNPTYLALRDDLKSLDIAVGNIAILNVLKDPQSNASFISDQIGFAEVAAKPVCEARQKVSELGDKATRNDLDVICNEIETMRWFVKDGNPKGATELAVLLNHGVFKTACEKVSSHVSGKITDCYNPR